MINKNYCCECETGITNEDIGNYCKQCGKPICKKCNTNQDTCMYCKTHFLLVNKHKCDTTNINSELNL